MEVFYMNNTNLGQLEIRLERNNIKFDRVSRDSKIVDRMKLQRIDYLIRRFEDVSTK